MFGLEAIVMFVNLGPVPHLFKLAGMLLFLGQLILFGLLVLELPVVHNTTYGRLAGRSNLNQIQANLAGPVQSLRSRNNTNLPAFMINQANWRHFDAVVNPHKLVSYENLLTIQLTNGTVIRQAL